MLVQPAALQCLGGSYLAEVASIPHETGVVPKAQELDSMAEPPVDHRLAILPYDFCLGTNGPLGDTEPESKGGTGSHDFRQKE